MNLALALIVVGILFAFFLSHIVGVALILIGGILLLAGAVDAR